MDVVYIKANPSEIINKSDLIMLDTQTGYVTKTKSDTMEDYVVNSNLVIGVCSNSNNDGIIPELIDCGNSKVNNDTIVLDNGMSKQQYKYVNIDGSYSNKSVVEEIEVQHYGEINCNIQGEYNLGDRLCMGTEPGKVQSVEYLNNKFIPSRKIGKVIGDLGENKVRVLLDIE